MTRYQSWGNFPRPESQEVYPLHWLSEVVLPGAPSSLLPYAYGRSYGDSCLNDGGALLAVGRLNRLIAFDDATGVVRAEAGISLEKLLEFAVPRGYFLPVTPGTKYISLGGAIANDVHGKNHHRAGTFGRHVRAFELLRSDGARIVCSETENAEMFRATVGGLGLTGLILWVELALRPIAGATIASDSVKFGSVDDFFAISAESDEAFEYTVAWVDCSSRGRKLGRGLFTRGNHAPGPLVASSKPKLAAPIDAPNFALNRWTVQAFNTLYYNKQRQQVLSKEGHYESFFYPLDAVGAWNRIYGERGFLQYQFVLPFSGDTTAIREVFDRIAASKQASFLAVLKMFGDLPSPGLLSFPRPGVTLALDFANGGAKTMTLLEELDGVVHASGGRVYPAKDARMSAAHFQAFYPEWRTFEAYIDPRFSSSFWRRVTDPLSVL